MGNALLSSVSGMNAHQMMIDVAGNNLANMSTEGFKSSRVTFADLLSETLAQASQPTESVGGTNPIQLGSGTKLASIDRDMGQGTLTSTGKPLDMAIEGEGFFTLHDGEKEVYTRVGAFAVDSAQYLVDPVTGYRVQRFGSTGEAEGFQDPISDTIRLPYDTSLPAQATSEVSYNGNLSSDEISPTTNVLGAGFVYTSGGAGATEATLLTALDQVTGNIIGADIDITGTERDGTPVATTLSASYGGPIDAATTVQDILDAISGAFTDSTASLYNGEIRLTDDAEGYSQTDLYLELTGGPGGTMTLPDYFKLLSAGGTATRNTNIEIFDTQGVGHTLSGAFVKTDTNNQWDFVVTAVSGDAELHDRRVLGITFQADGSYGGLDDIIGDTATLQMEFGNDPGTIRTIDLDLGRVGEFDGLTQFGGAFTVAPSEQNGYPSGSLSSVSVTREGVLQGLFTNGERMDLAALKVALFQNPASLEAIGGNYFIPSGNSGDPLATNGLSGGAGAVHGGSLEQSNVDVAKEFVNLITAQNGYQANARTIRVSNEMLKELTSLLL